MITFPHLGNMSIFVKAMCNDLKVDYIEPPACSKRTLELGIKYSPEMVCLPLKITLGNFIESIELGADTIIMTGGCGPCRFGYYAEMHKEMLKTLGYDVKVITLETTEGLGEMLRRFKEAFGTSNIMKIAHSFMKAYRIIDKVDNLDVLCYKTRARELRQGTTDRIMNNFRKKIRKVEGVEEINRLIDETREILNNIELDTSIVPLKIGLVGDIYTLIEPESNMRMEQLLGNMRIEVMRSLTISKWIREHYLMRGWATKERRAFDRVCKPYLELPIGGHARESIGNSGLYAEEGFDGIIQVYPLTCMPEIVASSILPALGNDYDIPILTLILDEMTGEAGFKTRIDAFADVLLRRRERKVNRDEYILSRN